MALPPEHVTPPAAFRAFLRVGAEEHGAAIVGLSVFGCTLRSPMIVPLGTFLPVRLWGVDHDSVHLQGVVTSIRPRLHLRFEGMSHRQRDELAAFVADVRRLGGEHTQPLTEREETSEIDIKAQVAALAQEVARLRDGDGAKSDDDKTPTKNLRPKPALLPAPPKTPPPTTSTIVALMAAVDPMLWGLEEASRHFERQGVDDDGAMHIRHLRLLERLLRRLNTEIQRQEAQHWHED
jgi:hypothetical protein